MKAHRRARPARPGHHPHRMLVALATSALAAAAPAHTSAATSATPDTDSAWHVRASVLGYFPAIYGNTHFPSGQSGPGFRINPHTILRSLNFGFLGELHVTRGPWGGLLNLRYTDLSKHVRGSHDFTVPGVPVPAGVTGDFGLRDKMTMMTLAGTWQALASPGHELYLLAGTRMLQDRQRLHYRLSAPIVGVAHEGTGHARSTNWDAIVGVMGRQRFTRAPHWFVPYYLDVGTGDSRFTMQASLGVGYAFRWGEITAAWRYVDYQYKSGPGVSRLRYTGPTVGVTRTF